MTTSDPRPIFVLAEQLVQAWVRNASVLDELERLRQRRKRVLAYLLKPGFNSRLALAYVERIEQAQREQLARLRAARRETLDLLARADELLPSRTVGEAFAPVSPATPSLSPPAARKYA